MLTSTRSLALPDLPSAQEQDLKGFEVYNRNAVFLPRGTPPAIVKKLNEALIQAMDKPSFCERLKTINEEQRTCFGPGLSIDDLLEVDPRQFKGALGGAFGVLASPFKSRAKLDAEILVPRQQVNVLRRRAHASGHPISDVREVYVRIPCEIMLGARYDHCTARSTHDPS